MDKITGLIDGIGFSKTVQKLEHRAAGTFLAGDKREQSTCSDVRQWRYAGEAKFMPQPIGSSCRELRVPGIKMRKVNAKLTMPESLPLRSGNFPISGPRGANLVGVAR